MSPGRIYFMAALVGSIVANSYYLQPLLADMGRSFQLSVTQTGTIATLTQSGTCLGMLLCVPLGDTCEKRSLIVRMLLAEAVALALVASATGPIWLALASLMVGLLASAAMVVVPFAASLAPDEQRGRVVGTVLSGLILGMLLARTGSGLLGAQVGWRSVYWVAAGLMLVAALAARAGLPVAPPGWHSSYGGLLKSLLQLTREQPQLRQSALLGALFFWCFSAFWTTLVFLLEAPPYGYGSRAAGLFGLVGAAGAALAPLVGRSADRFGTRATLGVSLLLVLVAYLVLGLGATHLAGLIAGVVLLDVGVQSGHVSNQTRIYGLVPGARSRLNTVYMVCYFAGGALGSQMGAYGFHGAGWSGVCLPCVGVISLGLAVWARGNPGDQ